MSNRLPIDPFIAAIVGMLGLAALLPAQGQGIAAVGIATKAAIALMFFLHGARLAPAAALVGARHWRLHLVVLLSTFILFPALGLSLRAALPNLLTPVLWTGVILLTVLPSTAQASIAFTAIARGNVPAALCAATASNLLGMALTPLLAGLLLGTQGGFSVHGMGNIALQLLLPFVAGQIARPLIGAWADRNKTLLSLVDRSSILLVVYGAFSAGMNEGIWHQIDLRHLLTLGVIDACLLAVVLLTTAGVSRALGFSRADEIMVVFCGSKKSLATGLPMASILLAGQSAGLIVLPMMLFHQIQLMACAALARRYAAQTETVIEHRLKAA